MPTGVPIHDVGDQLFDAAARVLRRDGPDALTSRAVTTEAGVAKGILHRHFADFDTFLASLVLARIERLDGRSEALRSEAGSGTVADNLVAALTASLDADALAIVALVLSRRDLFARLRLTTPTGIPVLAETTRMIAAYLTAERGLGRIALDTDVDRLALALVGAAHLLLAGQDTDELRDLVAAVIAVRP
ncbi:MAG TPA: helix-turn-helix domain-containing protein [Solirubrobacter sp.]|nr:helix-turn-helix domain-containing protein [Solirubrobacter sp.]